MSRILYRGGCKYRTQGLTAGLDEKYIPLKHIEGALKESKRLRFYYAAV